ncbi:unannotated protein [freshwater metagenome]|uniref:Unannotated protein n=1 Tax=freshwater metagenome TaxID=449393 RepID=A0A6J6KNH9_9ZZZZ
MQQSLSFTLGQLVHRNTCPRCHDGGNVLIRDLVVDHPVSRGLTVFCGGDRGFDSRDDFVVELGRVLITAFTHGAVEVNTSVVELGFQLTNVLE